jgi:hypothetical protein
MDATQLSEAQAQIEARKAETGRNCGSCAECCFVMEVEDPELTKPNNVWCAHCRPGRGGCTIYSTRPTECRIFACDWLIRGDPRRKAKWSATPKRIASGELEPSQ